MEPISSLLSYVTAPIMALIGYLVWAIKGIQGRVDELERETLSEKQIRTIVNDKLDVIRSQHAEMGARIGRLESKIDRLIDVLNGRCN